MTPTDQTKMKKKRRTLKNRGYAETTRRKKEDEIKKLETELKHLEVCLFSIQHLLIQNQKNMIFMFHISLFK